MKDNIANVEKRVQEATVLFVGRSQKTESQFRNNERSIENYARK